MNPDFDEIIALRIKGFAKAAVLAECAGTDTLQAQTLLDGLLQRGWAEDTRLGLRLTADGKAEAQRRIDSERAALDAAAMQAVYARFCALNTGFKQLVTDWQMRSVDGRPVINDHQDAAHDRTVLARLDALHPEALALLADAARVLPRLGHYARRLAAALQRVQAGDARYLTAPLIDSYHTAWFELHQDLIQACGLNRADEAAAGRAH